MTRPISGVPNPMFSGRPSRLAALAGALLLAIGALSLWLSADRGRADAASVPPPAEVAAVSAPDAAADRLETPAPRPEKSREEQRFARADRDDDGRIAQAEYLHARRRNFDKLDRNADGVLQFAEYAASGIAKFASADTDRDGHLDGGEYAATAPKPKIRQTASADACRCPQTDRLASSTGEGED